MSWRDCSCGVSRAVRAERQSVQASAQTPQLLTPARLVDRRRVVDWLATAMVVGSAALAVTVLLLILGDVILQGISALNIDFFTQRPLPPGEVGGGVAPAIVGTLEMLVVAGLIGIPVGVGRAIYLSEYGRGGLAR